MTRPELDSNRKRTSSKRKPRAGAGFFAIDSRTWAKVCNYGINAAASYLALARGTERTNRFTSWSVTSLQKYIGISFVRGQDAIKTLIDRGFVRNADKHTPKKPRYELLSWTEINKAEYASRLAELDTEKRALIEKARRKPVATWSMHADELTSKGFLKKVSNDRLEVADPPADTDPELIWLPNTLISGTERGEEPPVKRLRRFGDVRVLQLFIDLYHSQNLRDDAGISPWLARENFSRKLLGQQGTYTLWAFKSESYVVQSNKLGALESWARAHSDTQQSAFFPAMQALLALGLMTFVPHIWDNELRDAKSCEGEVVYPYGIGICGEPIELEIARAAHQAAERMALPRKVCRGARGRLSLFRAGAINYPELLPYWHWPSSLSALHQVNRNWWAELQVRGKELISGFDNLCSTSDLQEHVGSKKIKVNQCASKVLNEARAVDGTRRQSVVVAAFSTHTSEPASGL